MATNLRSRLNYTAALARYERALAGAHEKGR